MTHRVLIIAVALASLLLSVSVPLNAQTITPEPDSTEMPAGLTIRVVQRGETLLGIARSYGLTAAELAEINGLSNFNSLQTGQRLLVPADDTANTVATQTHIVQPGETFSGIANFYGISLTELLSINALTAEAVLFPGQELSIVVAESEEAASSTPIPTTQPESTPAIEVTPQTTEATTEAPIPQAEDDPVESNLEVFQPSVHTVQSGDTLFRIAQRYGTTVSALTNLNSLVDPTRIYSGQQLLIPGIEDAPEIALDVPESITRLQVSPLIFVEGETGVIRVETAIASTITGTFLGRDLRVIALDGALQHVILIGIPVFTDAGNYPVALSLSNSDGTQSDFTFTIRIASAGYFTQNLNVATQTPVSVQDEEISLLTNITSAFTEERRYDGLFSIPAAAAMNAPFGTRRSYNNGPINTYHTGADFASAPGAPIFAAADGQVVLADGLNVRGNTVMIDHGWGIYSLYAHLTTINVSLGETVTTGQILGGAGSTGRVTGPHLHWEIWVNGIPVNPLQWLQRTFP